MVASHELRVLDSSDPFAGDGGLAPLEAVGDPMAVRARPSADGAAAAAARDGEPSDYDDVHGMAALGRRVMALRWERGMTQTEVAEAAGISGGYMSLIEMGRRNPTPEVVAAVADALGTSARYLVTGIDETAVTDVRTMLDEAHAARARGDAARAVSLFRRVLARPEPARLTALWASAVLGHAGALEECGAVAEAVTELRRLLGGSDHRAETAARLDRDFPVRAGAALCRCLTRCGDSAGAIALAEETLPRLGPRSSWGTAAVEFVAETVLACLEHGDHGAADRLARDLSGTARDLGHTRARVIAGTVALAVAEARGAGDGDLRLAEETAALAARPSDPPLTARARMACAQIMLAAATPAAAEDARTLFAEAEKALPPGPAFAGERGRCRTGRARAELRLGLPRAAIGPCRDAIALLDDGPPWALADAYVAMAEAFRRMQRRGAAAASLTTAHRVLRKDPGRRRVAAVWSAAADQWAALGDPERQAEALRGALDRMGV